MGLQRSEKLERQPWRKLLLRQYSWRLPELAEFAQMVVPALAVLVASAASAGPAWRLAAVLVALDSVDSCCFNAAR